MMMQGGTAKGGEPNVDGFPLRDGDTTSYSKNCYKISSGHNIWVSYEIVTSDNAMMYWFKDNTQDYPLFSYGQTTYTYMYCVYNFNW